MYHKIITKETNIVDSINKFKQHLSYLQQNFNIVLPGQKLSKDKISVCLTFDDAYADFYIYIFPLLQQMHIPVVLAIPVNYIAEETTLGANERLSQQDLKTACCTWKEIREMVATGLVYPASHGFSHVNLTQINFSEVFKEICTSKRIIWTKLEYITETLIYPFGAQNRVVYLMAKNHYKYLIRIGSAVNFSWNQKNLYRVDADHFWQNNKAISKLNLCGWASKYVINIFGNK